MVTRDDLVEVTTVDGFEGANMLEKRRGKGGEKGQLEPLSTESSDEGHREFTLQSFRALWLDRDV